MTVKQVSSLTGVSIRALQFYDEIGLFKPAGVTEAGYRLYDENSLDILQQILFFKELDFTLKEIKAIMDNPHFDKEAAFKKQRELIQMKRDRLDSLLGLLDRLIEGELCMEFDEFDMSRYFSILEEFKKTHAHEITERLGDMETFDRLVSAAKSDENTIAESAVKLFGSLENFTAAMEKNVKNFLENGPVVQQSEVGGIIEKTEELTRLLTADLSKDPESPEVYETAGRLMEYVIETNKGIEMGQNYWPYMAESYRTNPNIITVNDKKYGDGASDFIGRALLAYLDSQKR